MSARHTYIISACILLSRACGLVREVLLARYLGVSIYSDAIKAALRIPNFLQNLFGEGVLSACFIPEYTRLRHSNHLEEAKRLVWELALLLVGITLSLSAIGYVYRYELVLLFAPGFSDNAKELTALLLSITFPATGVLVLSALCLGILNSHRLFALSYASPLAWNFAVISALVLWGSSQGKNQLSETVAYAVLVGSALQLFIQIPTCMSLLRSLPSQKAARFPSEATTRVAKNFVPVVVSRGVVQVSSYLDTIFASFLAIGSLSALMYAQTIYLLPISVFGLASAAAALPGFSEFNFSHMSYEQREKMRMSLQDSLSHMLKLVVPISCVLIVLPQIPVTIIFFFAELSRTDMFVISATVASLSLGIIPSTISRVLSSLLYAADQQKVVLRFALVRLIVSASCTYALCFVLLPRILGDQALYVTGIGVASCIAGIVELSLLNRHAAVLLEGNIIYPAITRKNGARVILGLTAAGLLLAGFVQYLLNTF